MILRRFMKHVTDQNWFAVGLDVIVVITGIFLGMQVQGVYDERGERHIERAYLQRLHSEVIQNLGFNEVNFAELLLLENFQQNEKYLDEVLNYFSEPETTITLLPDHCLAIMSSAIYNDQQTYLPTLTELLSSGQLSVVQNDSIKVALSEYTMAFDALKQQVDTLSSSRIDIHQKHPHLIKIDTRMRNINQSDYFSHKCDFDTMKSNQSFSNDLTINASKRFYFNLILAKQQSALSKVHSSLDKELGISHQEKAKEEEKEKDRDRER